MSDQSQTTLRSVKRMVMARSISAIGSRLTTFALDIWVYQTTGSYRSFVLLAFLAALTTLLIGPWAGARVDASHKGKTLLITEYAALTVILASFLALLCGRLSVPLIGATIVLMTAADAFRWPAIQSSITALTPKEDLGQINGLLESWRSATVVAGPLLGAAAVASIGMQGIFAIDIATFLVSIALIRSLVHNPALEGLTAVQRKVSGGVRFAFKWLLTKPPLLGLLGFFAAINCGFAIITTMQVPYILSLTNPTGLSICIATMGLGTLTGGRLFGHFSRSLCAETTLLVGVGIESIAVACLGASSSVLVMSVCTLTMGATASFAAAANQTIWQRNVPYELQGRVISARSILAFSTPPLALLTAIPLQKGIFEPWLGASTPGQWVHRIWAGEPVGLMLSTLAAGIFIITVSLLLLGGFGLSERKSRLSPSQI